MDRIASPRRFIVYASALGGCFYADIRRVLAQGLRESGAEVREADEREGFSGEADWRVVVAPHEFFYLGRGARLRRLPWPRGVILYNTEQTRSRWFSKVRRLLPRAHAVWEMDRATAGLLAGEGWSASYLPPGWSGDELFDIGRLPALEDRPVDLLFAGSRVPRREAFFRSADGLLRRCESVIRLMDDSRLLRREANGAADLLELSRGAKIVLNLHRHEAPYFEWHRMVLHGIAQGALVISEPTTGAPPFKAGRDFVEAPLQNIPEAVSYYLSSRRGRAEAAAIAASGLRTYRRDCRLTTFLKSALAELGRALPPAARRARRRDEAAAALLAEAR
ncbi:MAG: hypothetical protein HY077_15670 [Elusimicrobia bacterium]|nr:hypothetical protein [Elusimicrobiota bacterium]